MNGQSRTDIYDRIANGFTFDSETDSFQIKLQKWNAAEQTTIVTAIEGGYYDMEEDKGTPIDLTQKLGLAADEFTASFRADGEEEATPIENVKAFTPEKEGTILVTVNKEGFAEAEFEIGFLFALEPLPYGQLLFDDGFRRYTATMEGKEGSSAKEYPVTTATVGEYAAFTSTFKGGWPKFKITSEELKALANFDTITVRYKFTGGGWFGLEKDSYTTTYTSTDGEWTLRTWHRNNEYGKENAGEAIWAALAKGELTMLPCSGTDGAEYTFTLAEITGGYYDIEAEEGQSVDLTAKFNLSVDEFTAEFTPESGEAQSVTDLAAFEPTANGTLQLTINKDGYAARELSVNVKILTEAYGTILRLDDYEAGDTYANVTGTSVTATVIDDSVSGGKAIKIVNSGANQSTATLTVSGDAVKTIANFDYFVIKARLLFDGVAANVNLQVSNVSNRPSWGDYPAASDGEGTEYEWVFDKVTNQFTFNAETNSFTVKFQKWDAAEQTTIVTAIEGGYYDIESDGTTAINLAERYGAGLVRAVYTPEGGDAQTLKGDDLKAFTGAQSGTLQLVFSVSGCKTTTFTLNYTVQAAAQG